MVGMACLEQRQDERGSAPTAVRSRCRRGHRRRRRARAALADALLLLDVLSSPVLHIRAHFARRAHQHEWQERHQLRGCDE